MAFDVAAAKKEGYSDAEIAEHLAKQKGFDIAGARKEGYSDAELLSHLSGSPVSDWSAQAIPDKLSLGDVIGGATLNAPKDVWGVAKSLFKTVTHPGEAMEGLSNVGAGAIAKLFPASLPDWAVKKTPEALAAREKFEGSAEQFGEHYKKRYGGWENIKRSVMEHPAETGLDIATVVAPVAKRMPGFKLGERIARRGAGGHEVCRKEKLPFPRMYSRKVNFNAVSGGLRNLSLLHLKAAISWQIRCAGN